MMSFVRILVLAMLLAGGLSMPTRGEEPIEIASQHLRMRLNGANGDIESLVYKGQELLFRAAEPRALFTVRLREADGAPVDLTSLTAGQFSVQRTEDAGQTVVILQYKNLAKKPIDATVQIRCPAEGPMTYWRLSLRNRTGLMIDHIDFPTVVVPNDLVATGGDGRVFWPAMEGVLIEDIDIREKSPWRFQPIEHPTAGWIGLYPSSCPMQFMAHYGRQSGVYVAAHDAQCHPKGIEVHPHSAGGIQLDYRLFPGGVTAETYAMPYEMAIGGFEGDWHDAADCYRSWIESSTMPRPPKLAKNPIIPAWFEQSPVVVTYPVRGTHDRDKPDPNEYYPYTNALPRLRALSEACDSKLLALLMHWEGSAPWAPPYVWPPYGDIDNFQQFVKELHKDGNLLGLYASGISYTLRSNVDPQYDMSKEFEAKKLLNVVTVAPDGSPCTNGVCAGPQAQRIGYDMCPACDFVKETVRQEVAKVLPCGVDYLQFFDQNLGGCSYRCYSRKHGHPAAPGLWQNEEMIALFKQIDEEIKRSGRKVLLGCEAAAGEFAIPYLPLNDLRFSINLRNGVPVPAYAYVNHEYVNNFMGNQNGSREWIDFAKSPLNLHQRLAYAFVAGDLLTVVLKEHGKICWDWGSPWNDGDDNNQTELTALIRNLNAWRRGAAKPYLVYGRMLKPLPIAGDYDLPMVMKLQDKKLPFRSVFTSRWSANGKTGQILANYTPKAQTVVVSCTGLKADEAVLYKTPTSPGSPVAMPADGQLKIHIEPLSAVLMEMSLREEN